jgi:hypothetical protein
LGICLFFGRGIEANSHWLQNVGHQLLITAMLLEQIILVSV